LGRLLQIDERNREHPLPRKKIPRGVRSRTWHDAGITDQGATSMCVGYSAHGWLRCGPVVNNPPFSPAELYKWAQENDEWEGEDYDGSSTLGVMKALKARGYISDYKWAFDAETLAAWVLTTGPVLVGTNWYRDMFTPLVGSGFIEPTGENDGGHEWRIVGVNLDKKCPDGTKGAVRMCNSWGKGWGQQGRAWISLEHLDQLIKDQGEAVTATEILVK
jgi:hypothetical protein